MSLKKSKKISTKPRKEKNAELAKQALKTLEEFNRAIGLT